MPNSANVTLRQAVGRAMTYEELDTNFSELIDTIDLYNDFYNLEFVPARDDFDESGWSKSTPNVAPDIDDYTLKSGQYSTIDGETLGTFPSGVDVDGKLLVTRHDSDDVTQRYNAVGDGTESQRFFKRSYNATTDSWESWIEDWTTYNLNPVTLDTDQTITGEKTFTDNVLVSKTGNQFQTTGSGFFDADSTPGTGEDAIFRFFRHTDGANDYDVIFHAGSTTWARFSRNSGAIYGTPTESFKGAGTINAENLYVNGNFVWHDGNLDPADVRENTTFQQDVTISGNLTVSGQTVQVDSEISTADRVITLNDGETGAGVTNSFSGVEIDRGTQPFYEFGFNEDTGLFELGEVGDRQPVATREFTPTDNGLAIWSDAVNRFNTLATTTVGRNFVALGTPTSNSFTRVNSNGSIENRTFAQVRSDLGISTTTDYDGRYLNESSNLSDVDNAITSFNNIKQFAGTDYAGVTERATVAETVTGTDTSRHVTPEGVHAAFNQYGLGSNGEQYTNNPDNLTLTQFKNIGGSGVGFMPHGGPFVNIAYNAGNSVQFGGTHSDNVYKNRFWARTQTSGVWNPTVEFWTTGNMGSDSGLDADLLDGQHGSYYRNVDNMNAGTLNIGRGGTGSTTASGAFNNIKQAATTSSAGVVEKATNQEALDGTASKFPDAADMLSSIQQGGYLRKIGTENDPGTYANLLGQNTGFYRVLDTPLSGTRAVIHVEASGGLGFDIAGRSINNEIHIRSFTGTDVGDFVKLWTDGNLSDPMTLSGAQTVSGAKTFSDDISLANVNTGLNFDSGAEVRQYDSDFVASLVGGTPTGLYLQGTNGGNVVVGLKSNGNNDRFYIVSESTTSTSASPDTVNFSIDRESRAVLGSPGGTSVSDSGTLNAQGLYVDGTSVSDADILTSGTLSDGRLSTNVSLLNATREFTAEQRFNDGIRLNIPDAGSYENRRIEIAPDGDGNMEFKSTYTSGGPGEIVFTRVNTDILRMHSDRGVSVGAPTGDSSQGSGTLNAEGLYVNSNSVWDSSNLVKTASASDTTSNRITQVGDYGPGSTDLASSLLLNSGSADDIDFVSWHRTTTGIDGLPSGSPNGLLETFATSSSTRLQRYQPINTDDAPATRRLLSDGTWTDWLRFIQVGDYGLGASNPDFSSNPDNLLETQFMRIGGSGVGFMPHGGAFVHMAYNDGNAVQFGGTHPNNTTQNRFWGRTQTDGVWNDTVEFWTTKDMPNHYNEYGLGLTSIGRSTDFASVPMVTAFDWPNDSSDPNAPGDSTYGNIRVTVNSTVGVDWAARGGSFSGHGAFWRGIESGTAEAWKRLWDDDNLPNPMTTDTSQTINGTKTFGTGVRFDVTSPAILVRGGNSDVDILRVSSDFEDSSDYGFSFRYMGSGSGNLNNLSLYADNEIAATPRRVFTVRQDGNIWFDRAVKIGTPGGGTDGFKSAGELNAEGLYVNDVSVRNAAILNEGTLSDSRLSDNVPLLNANQTFTGTNVFEGTTVQHLGNQATLELGSTPSTGDTANMIFRSGGVLTHYFNDSTINTIEYRVHTDTNSYTNEFEFGISDTDAGNFRAAGDVTANFSDERLKTVKENLKNSRELIRSWKTFKYTSNDLAKEIGASKNNNVRIGLSAQSVEETHPELTTIAPFDYDNKTGGSLSGENYLTLKYDRTVAVLVNATNEQSDIIDEQQEKINDLESRLARLEKLLEGND